MSVNPKKEEETTQNLSKRKYILFVGNLSFDTTNDDLKKFFEDTKPSSIRLITDKFTKKSKGFAFVEFTGSKYLETALSKDKSKIKDRKINIELTAGGGGSKSEIRKERIKSKNEKFQLEKQEESDPSTTTKSKSKTNKNFNEEF